MTEGAGADDLVLGGAIDLQDLFPAAWVREHTEYENIDAFLAACGDGDEEELPRSALDVQVRRHTEFESWGEMLSRALAAYDH